MITEIYEEERCDSSDEVEEIQEIVRKPRRIITTKYDYRDKLCEKYPLISRENLMKVVTRFSENLAKEIRNGYYFRTATKNFSFYICPNMESGVSSMLLAREDLRRHKNRKKIIAFNYSRYIKNLHKLKKKRNERTNK